MAPCAQFAAVAPAPLIRIRSGVRAAWAADLLLSVETGIEGWTATVRRDGRAIYTAQRSSLEAARTAAVEFAAFRDAGPACWESLERLARHLQWREYW
jgi:hypothetical protein